MNEIRQRGPIARFFVGLWDAMNFTRRLVFNLLFFGLLLIVLAAIASGDTAKPLLDRTTLVIAPEGKLVEQYSTDAASRALAKLFGDDGKGGEVQLRDLLRTIDEAKDDKRIERVLLRVDRMSFSGYASIREVAAALAKLRASGKQIVAFGESFDQGQYLLAALANEVYIEPMGGLLL
jgi:protease-4